MCFSLSLILFVATYNIVAYGVDIDSRQTIESSNQELLVGYKMLHHTLKKEAQLKYLHWLREATFRGPKGSLKSVMTTIYKTSKSRKGELEALWKEYEPIILLQDAPYSAMSDSIQDDVEKASLGELIRLPSIKKKGVPRLEWGVRFMFIQAQATRIIVALSTSLKKLEENEERKQWLTNLADEYEGIRESVVDFIVLNLVDDDSRKAQQFITLYSFAMF